MEVHQFVEDDNQSDTSEEDWTDCGDVSDTSAEDADHFFDNWKRADVKMSTTKPEIRFLHLTSDIGILAKEQNIITTNQLKDSESAVIDRHSYIRLHGVTKAGNSVCCNVFGYSAYLLVLPRPNFEVTKLHEFESNLLRECIRTLDDRYKEKWFAHFDDNIPAFTATIVDSDKELKIVQYLQSITSPQRVSQMDSLKQSVVLKVRNPIPRLIWTASKVLRNGKLKYPLDKTTTQPYNYEAYFGTVNQTLRFLCDMSISGCSWIRILDGKYVLRDGTAKLSEAQIELDVLHTDLSTGPKEPLIAPLRILSLDIEVLTEPPLFEFPSNGNKRVLQIGSILTTYGSESSAFHKFVFTLGSCGAIPGVVVFSYEKEKHLLNAWRRFVIAVDPDIVTGYNIKKFDLPYLLRRAERIDTTSQLPFLGRTKKIKAKTRRILNKSKGFTVWDKETVTISGRIILDMYLLVMRHNTKPSTDNGSTSTGEFKLDNVAKRYLNEAKRDVNYAEIWELQSQGTMERAKLAEYCVHDTALALLLVFRLFPDAKEHPNKNVLEYYIKKSEVLGVPLNYLVNKSPSYAVYCQIIRKAVNDQQLISETSSNQKTKPYQPIELTASTFLPSVGVALLAYKNRSNQVHNDKHLEALDIVVCSARSHLDELTNYITVVAADTQQLHDENQQLERKIEELKNSISAVKSQYQAIMNTSRRQLSDCPNLSKVLALPQTSQSQDVGGTATTPQTEKVLTDNQRDGVQFLHDRVCYDGNEGSGAIIACPVGTGKTAIILTWYQELPESKSGSMLILCTKNGLENWKREICDWVKLEFLNKFYVLEGKTSLQEQVQLAKVWSNSRGILLATYNTYLRLVQRATWDSTFAKISATFVNPGPAICVLDEGHVVRNSATKLSEAISRVYTQRKIVVTGTPVQNSLADVYALVHLVKPGSLGCRTIFNHRIEKPFIMGMPSPFGLPMSQKRGQRLHDLVSTVFYSSSGETPLPIQQEWILHLRPSESQRELLGRFLEMIYSTSGFQEKHNYSVFEVESVISRLLAHPDILFTSQTPKTTWADEFWKSYTPGCIENGVKLEILFEIFKNAAKASQKVLVYSKYLETLDLVECFLKTNMTKYKYLRVDGSTSSKLRQKTYNDVNDSEESIILLITTGSGSDSVNLHGASVTVLIDVNWNPGVDVQCQGRTRRYGHSNVSVVYRLVVDNTLDELKLHRQLQKILLGSQVVGVQRTTRDEAKNSFEFLQQDAIPSYSKYEPRQVTLPDHILKLTTTLKSRFGNPIASPYGEPWRTEEAPKANN